MTQTEALRLALEALGWTDEWRPQGLKEEAITAIKEALAESEPNYKKSFEVWLDKTEWVQETVKPHELGMHRADVLKQRIEEALAQPEQEPVAYINVEQRKLEWAKYMSWDTPTVVNLPKIPLYITPPQRTWAGLTPACPQGLTEYACEVEGVDLVCFLEYTPDEEGSRDSRGLLDEPGTYENMELVNAYVKGTDIDIGHLLLQGLVDHITTTALEDYKNDDL